MICIHKLTRSNRKHLEDISHAHIVSFLYKLITCARDSDDMSTGFDRDRNKRQRELTNISNKKENIMLEICLPIHSVLLNTKKKLVKALDIN